MATVTITSKGQVTLPAMARQLLDLKDSSKLTVTVDPKTRSITLTKPMTVDELAELAHTLPRKKIKPVMDVDAYYQRHRAETIR